MKIFITKYFKHIVISGALVGIGLALFIIAVASNFNFIRSVDLSYDYYSVSFNSALILSMLAVILFVSAFFMLSKCYRRNILVMMDCALLLFATTGPQHIYYANRCFFDMVFQGWGYSKKIVDYYIDLIWDKSFYAALIVLLFLVITAIASGNKAKWWACEIVRNMLLIIIAALAECLLILKSFRNLEFLCSSLITLALVYALLVIMTRIAKVIDFDALWQESESISPFASFYTFEDDEFDSLYEAVEDDVYSDLYNRVSATVAQLEAEGNDDAYIKNAVLEMLKKKDKNIVDVEVNMDAAGEETNKDAVDTDANKDTAGEDADEDSVEADEEIEEPAEAQMDEGKAKE